jgi:hypothetical protein
MRPTSELVHIVAVGYRHGSYDVEFLLGCPPAAGILFGNEPTDPSDPNFALALGAAVDFRRKPRLNGFKLSDGMADDEVTVTALVKRLVTTARRSLAGWSGSRHTRIFGGISWKRGVRGSAGRLRGLD